MNALAFRHSCKGRNPGGFSLPFALARSAGLGHGFERAVSPAATYFSLRRQRKVSKRKATRIRWCRFASLPCDARLSGALRNSHDEAVLRQSSRTAPRNPALLGTSHGAQQHVKSGGSLLRNIAPMPSPLQAGEKGGEEEAVAGDSAVDVAGDVLLGPLVGAEKRRRGGGIRTGCVNEGLMAHGWAIGPTPERRASQGIAAGDTGEGCVFLWLLSFAQAKESDSPIGETTLNANTQPAERVSAINQQQLAFACPSHPNPLPQAGEGTKSGVPAP